MSIIDIGYLLVDNINSKIDLNKIKLMSTIGNYKKELELNKKLEDDKKIKYYNDYQKIRETNEINYNKYLSQNKILLDKWKKNNKTKDLYEYISLKKPDLEEVKDIYTINPIFKINYRSHRK